MTSPPPSVPGHQMEDKPTRPHRQASAATEEQDIQPPSDPCPTPNGTFAQNQLVREEGELSDDKAPVVDAHLPKGTDMDTETETETEIDGEQPPPLPEEPPPDDGWQPVWDTVAQGFYFYNCFTKATQWQNPRVPNPPSSVLPLAGPSQHDFAAPPTGTCDQASSTRSNKGPAGGYNPAIHGDYDPTASYAQEAYHSGDDAAISTSDNHLRPTLSPCHSTSAITAVALTEDLTTDSQGIYAATGAFNRFTGKWQSSDLTPDKFNDESKSKRQMNAFFDVEAAANNHDGRSLKAERQNKKFTRKEIKAFKDKRREKKEERRRAWLRD